MIRNILIAVFMLAATTCFAADTVYTQTIPDLPLMQGMTEQADDAVVFDKPSGRIVDVTVVTTAAPQEIEKFYSASLPPLGWTAAGHNSYKREHEMLSFTFEKNNIVRFSLSPIGE